MVKQNLCWTGHFIPPPPTENAWVLGVKGVLVAPRARACAKMAPILTPFWRARRAQDPIHPEDPFQGKSSSIKWPVQHRFCFFRGFTWTGHFIEACSVGGGGIKWPVQHRFCFFRGFTWTGHFIEAFSVWGGGIKWPVQHRFCFFRGFTWTGHYREEDFP